MEQAEEFFFAIFGDYMILILSGSCSLRYMEFTEDPEPTGKLGRERETAERLGKKEQGKKGKGIRVAGIYEITTLWKREKPKELGVHI